MTDRDDLRVGDAERDRTTAELHEHYAQGRLTREELDERLEAVLSARTWRDLRQVTRDLPGAHQGMPGSSWDRDRRGFGPPGAGGHPSGHSWGPAPWWAPEWRGRRRRVPVLGLLALTFLLVAVLGRHALFPLWFLLMFGGLLTVLFNGGSRRRGR